MQGKRAAPEELHRALTNATGKVATWQEVDLIKDHIAALEAEIASLKPSGQVAEDARTVTRELERAVVTPSVAEALHRLAAGAQHAESLQRKLDGLVAEDAATVEAYAFETGSVLPYQKDARAALSRLATKAQGYDAAVVDRDKAWSERATAIAEKHSAVADNAALVKRAKDIAEDESNILEWRNAAHAILGNDPHPGVALLEEMQGLRRELELVRKGELCPHEMPLQRIAEVVGAPGDLLSAHEVAARVVSLAEQHRKARDVTARLRARIESDQDPVEERDELVGYLDDLDAALLTSGRSGSEG
jgi:hypothetical protein